MDPEKQQWLDSLSFTEDEASDSQSDCKISDNEQEEYDDDMCLEDISWAHLPDILLERVLSLLSLRERYHASIVCRRWYEVFHSPVIWRKLVFHSTSFTHTRYTPHRGYWTELSHHKVQMLFQKFGAFLQTIQIETMDNFYNLFHFIHIWSVFIEYFDDYPMQSLTNFYFTFGCESREKNEVKVYGTGGTFLEEIKRLLNNLKYLEELRLNNLLLELKDAPGVLESVVINCGATLHFLEVRNFTKELYPLFIAGMFPNLTTLVLSPQQLSNDLVAMLPNTKVTNLHVVQDHLSYEGYQVMKATWKRVCEVSPDLNVHLAARGSTPLEINFQEGAPVTSIVYTTKFSKVHTAAVETITILYNTSLKLYGHYGLPRFFGSRHIDDRGDADLVMLVRTCYKLHTLIIRDRISTATLIIIAREGKRLRRIHVRRNGLIKKCDWSKTLAWSDKDYYSLKRASVDYESTLKEVSRCLGYKWEPLSDRQFKSLQPPNVELTSDVSGDFDTS